MRSLLDFSDKVAWEELVTSSGNPSCGLQKRAVASQQHGNAVERHFSLLGSSSGRELNLRLLAELSVNTSHRWRKVFQRVLWEHTVKISLMAHIWTQQKQARFLFLHKTPCQWHSSPISAVTIKQRNCVWLNVCGFLFGWTKMCFSLCFWAAAERVNPRTNEGLINKVPHVDHYQETCIFHQFSLEEGCHEYATHSIDVLADRWHKAAVWFIWQLFGSQ